MTHPLLRVTLSGLRAHAVRLLLTAFAVMIGVGFLSGALVYGDTARAAFFADMARSARNVDVLVQPPVDLGSARVAPDVVDQIRTVPGVAAVDGRVTETLAMADRNGRLITNFGQVGFGLSLPDAPSLARYGVASGRLPARSGEVAVDRGTVVEAGFRLGEPVRVLDHDGRPHDLALVGVLDLGVNRLFSGQSVAVLERSELATLTSHTSSADPLAYSEVAVSATAGTDPVTLRNRIAKTVAGKDSDTGEANNADEGSNASNADDDAAGNSGSTAGNSAGAGERNGPVSAGGYRVITGDQMRTELAERAAKYVDGFLRVLIGFGLVAITVSGFVIYNTFTILAAQRRRELALLRCVGASRRQVFGSVLGESLVLGVLASIGGLLLSLLIGYGLLLGRQLVGAAIPAHPLVLGWPTVGVAVGFGTVVTVASALVPAAAASRVPPLSALRDALANEPPPVRGRRAGRLVVAATAGGLGVATALSGRGHGFAGLPFVLGGAMLAFLGVVALAPLVIGQLTGAVGWLPGRLFGAPARLAAANARRNPRRAATTTAALMIGVALMSMISVLLATARVQQGRELTENFPVEYVLRPATAEQFRAWGARFAGTDGVPDAVVRALRQRPEFATVAQVRTASSRIAGEPVTAWAVEPDGLRGPVVPEVMAGDISQLRPGTVALRRDFAADAGIQVGDEVAMGRLSMTRGQDGRLTGTAGEPDSTAPEPGGQPSSPAAQPNSQPGGAASQPNSQGGGKGGKLRVIALYDDAPTDAQALLSWFQPGWRAETDQVLVDVADRVSTVAGRQALDAALRDHPLVRVDSLAERRSELTTSLNELLGIFAALLGMAVIIAMFGIGNTLSLSVHERTRESATLRALGLSRRQLRGMFLVEAALMAVLGSLAGVGFGVAVGWAAAIGLIHTYGHGTPVVPVAQLVCYVALATATALLAGVLPARQATRASIIAAMNAD